MKLDHINELLRIKSSTKEFDLYLPLAYQLFIFKDTNMETILNKINRTFEEKTMRHKSRNKSQRLYQRIHNLLKDAIINNEIPEGSPLPATRILAEKLNVSRSTIIRAYELLRLEGYIDSKTGAGHRVKSIHNDSFQSLSSEINEAGYPEISETGKSFLKNVSLINSTDDKSIAFRPGLPPLDIFPVNQWKNLSNLYWRYIKSSALSYSPSSGIEQLKKNIANYLNLNRGIKCDHRQIIIVSGSLQSLYLIGSVMLNPGDPITMENPTFPNVYSIFKSLRANIQPAGVDNEGLMVSEMIAHDHSSSKLVHTTPSCHYPTGARMSLTRRHQLLDWAKEHKAFIIENDYEHEVHNHRETMPSLFSLDKDQRTIYLSTFNRLLHPSIRIGYMVLPFYLLDAVEALLKHSHRFVPPSIQVVLNQFIEKNYLYTHVKHVVEVAEERKEIFLDTFNNYFDNSLSVVTNPVDTLHLSLKLNTKVQDKELVSLFGQHNIIAHAYSKCFASDEKDQGLILGFSSVRPPIIKRKLIQMAELYHKNYK